MSKKGDKRKQLKTRGRGSPQSASRGALSEYEELYDHKAGTFGGPSLFGAQRFALGGSVSDLSMLDRAAMSVRPRYSQAEKDWIAAREAEYADYNKAVDEYNAGVSDYQKLVDAYNESIKPYQSEVDAYTKAVDEYNKNAELYSSVVRDEQGNPVMFRYDFDGRYSTALFDPTHVVGGRYKPRLSPVPANALYGETQQYPGYQAGQYYHVMPSSPENLRFVQQRVVRDPSTSTDQRQGYIVQSYQGKLTDSPVFTRVAYPGEFTAKPPGNPPPAFTGVEPVAPTGVPYTQEQVQQYVDTAKQRAERSASSRALGLKVAADPSQYGLSGLSVGLPFKNGGEVSNAKFIRRRAKGSSDEGEVSNDEYIQQMMTGTPPTDQGSRPYDESALAQFADYLRAPVDLAQTAARGLVGSVAGPAYGVYKGLTGGKYGTPEGVREASEAGGELMQRITGEPKSQAARDVLDFIGKKAEEYKLAPMPQLMTLPVPGPGALRYPAEAAKTQAEDIALRAVRSQTENPDISAAELYNAMLGRQAPGAAIVKPTGTPTTVQAPQTPLGFYSAVEDTVLKLPQEKGTAQQLLAQISKAPGVKTKEVEATGLAEFLRSKGTAPVTKQEIQDFLANNRVQVDEVVLGKGQVMSPEAKQRMGEAENRMIEIDNQLALYFENLRRPDIDSYGTFVRLRGPVARKAAAGDAEAMAEIDALNLPPNIKQLLLEFGEQKNEYQKYAKQSRKMEKPRFDQYNIPGGENAREIYLTLPSLLKRAMSEAEIDRLDELARKRIESSLDGLSPAEQSEYFSLISKRERVGAAFTAPRSHSVSPEADTNRLAHIFLDDRTDAQGNKTLFVQELQSDWAQQGRDRGFIDDTLGKNAEYQRLLKQFEEGTLPSNQYNRFYELQDRLGGGVEAEQQSNIPRAPFVTNTEDWLNLALKRVIKEAVDSGADNVAFIKGEQAADKYSLRTLVDKIRVATFLSGDNKAVYIVPKNETAQIELFVNKDGIIEGASASRVSEFKNKPLSEVVGKELAEKIMSGKDQVISGEGLEMGGEGMKGFYDNIVPKTANKLLEKLGGGKVGPIDIGGSSEKSFGVSFDTTSKKWEANLDNKPIGSFATKEEAQAAAQAAYDKDRISYLGFKITPEMREIVKGQGLPQFAAGGEVTNFIKAHA